MNETRSESEHPTDAEMREVQVPQGAGPVRILIADDEESMRFYLKRSLTRRGYAVETVASGDEAIAAYEARRFGMALVDLKMPGADGLEVVRRIRKLDPEAAVVVMTGHGSIPTAVEAMRRGALDYLTKPFELDELLIVIERGLDQQATRRENRELRKLVDNRSVYGALIGQSPAMRSVYQSIDLLEQSDATVLISGESGTGKELVARAIHHHSPRASGSFVPLHCAALPEGLLENELFGHVAGAYTGAEQAKRGLVERADGGTLFLDEVGEISLASQVKLLRFLQEHEFTPLGGSETCTVDLRIVAATNRNLEQAVESGELREDLFWRLNVVPIVLPPLRDRREDIPALISHFIERYQARAIETVSRVSVDAMIRLVGYSWPGNVRQLENVVERLLVLHSREDELLVEHLPPEIREERQSVTDTGDPSDESYQQALERFEREYLSRLLEQTGGNVSEAARLSGLSRPNVHRKAKQLGLDLDSFR
ncbi:MAG: sigma-54 dependent transcriptional regulator [Planctomycetota bacterium]